MTIPNRPPFGGPVVPPIRPPIAPPIRPRPPNPPSASGTDAGISLATNFIVLIDEQPISCARAATLELAADVAQLERQDHPGPPPQVRWTAPAASGRLTLARALDGDRRLYEWRHEAMHGKPAVRSIVVQHLERAGGDVLHEFRMEQCWPLRWTGPRYDAFAGGIAFEELEVVYADLLWL